MVSAFGASVLYDQLSILTCEPPSVQESQPIVPLRLLQYFRQSHPNGAIVPVRITATRAMMASVDQVCGFEVGDILCAG
jgi:hypothetical protein